MFSVTNFINVFNKNQKGKSAPLVSEPYLVAQKFLENIKETLRLGPDNPKLIHYLEGGIPYEAFHLTRKVGLVSKESWKPKIPFEDWDTSKIYRVLRKKIPEYHEALAKVAMKTGSWDSLEVQEAKANAFAELLAVILEFAGPLPDGFTYGGKNYTPESFERSFGIPRLVSFYLHNSGEYAVPENHGIVLRQAFSGECGRYRVFDSAGTATITSIRDYIDQKLPVINDLKWRNDGHSMLVVGYELDEATNPDNCKVHLEESF